MSIEQDVKEVIVQTLSVKPEEINLDQSLYDSLGMDSTEIVDLRVAMEKRFTVKFDPKEISKSSSPKDIVNLLQQKGVST